MSELWVGVRDLKARLSEYLRQVSQGQTVIIYLNPVNLIHIICFKVCRNWSTFKARLACPKLRLKRTI